MIKHVIKIKKLQETQKEANMNSVKLAIIIPCYNEEETLPHTLSKLWGVIHELIRDRIISPDSFIFLVDDGSKDKTWEIIQTAHSRSFCKIKAVRFSRNYGNQAAILAGLEEARKLGVDAALTIDADLQQDVNKIGEFVKAYNEGYDIVAGVRNDRSTDTFFKKFCSNAFYKIINLLGVNITPNHSEFRLISRNTLNVLAGFHERNIFLRGLFNELGLETKYIPFDVQKREYGESKFSFFSLMQLAIDGIVSFSIYPLRFVFVIGVLISVTSFIVAVLIILDQILKFTIITNIELFKIWMTFISGIQILCIGIIGEYIGQVLLEVKGRPRYIISKELE